MQTFDSNGPEVRVRGNAHQVYEKYLNLARDATASGDRIAAEGFYQFAEHYYRIVNDSTDPQRNQPQQQDGSRPDGFRQFDQRGGDEARAEDGGNEDRGRHDNNRIDNNRSDGNRGEDGRSENGRDASRRRSPRRHDAASDANGEDRAASSGNEKKPSGMTPMIS